jgi:hypothetical protein
MTEHVTVNFRLYHMPCCAYLLQWADPKAVQFCPACGAAVPPGKPLETVIDGPTVTLFYEDQEGV